MTNEEMQRSHERLGILEQEMKSTGAWVFSGRLHEPDTATEVRMSAGAVVTTEAQVALTLRLLGGLSTRQVAGSFLVSEATMAARLVRAKRKIKAAWIPYRVPRAHELPDRLRSVLAVVYLIYNAGQAGLAEPDLCVEAIRLARILAALMPDEPEAAGLLALSLLTESRRAFPTAARRLAGAARRAGPHPVGTGP
jgi:predicted RNA polymerase sigma factor